MKTKLFTERLLIKAFIYFIPSESLLSLPHHFPALFLGY